MPGYSLCSTIVLYGIGVSSTNGKWGEAWLLTHLFFLSFTVVLTITFDLVPASSKEIPMIGKRYKACADPEGTGDLDPIPLPTGNHKTK